MAKSDSATHEQVSGTEQDVWARYRIKPGTLRTWRSRCEGPPYIKSGRSVLYRFAAVEAWLKANEIHPEDT